MNDEQLIEKYFLLKKKGMEYSQIRKELKDQGFEELSIRPIIKRIDNKIIKDLKSSATRNNAIELIILGIVVLTIGLVITIGTYTKWINMGDHIWKSTGLLIGGISTTYLGYKGYNSSK